MYLMTCTRPELAYPLSILARYVAPGRHRPEHMAAAKRVLRDLCSTSGLGLGLGGRSPVVLTGHADACWVDDLATQRSSQGYTFSLGSGSVSWRSTRSSSVLSSSCEVEIYAGAMAAQELRWLTYVLTDLGEPPRSPRVLYVDNKAMLALCREHRLEHKTKHIALRYFLARELQQHGQLRFAYVASQANTADIFTKALQPCDHQRFCTMLACFALLCLTGLGRAPPQLLASVASAGVAEPTATAEVAASSGRRGRRMSGRGGGGGAGTTEGATLGNLVTGAMSGPQPVAVSFSCRSLTHPSLLWHPRLGHPHLTLNPRLCQMAQARSPTLGRSRLCLVECAGGAADLGAQVNEVGRPAGDHCDTADNGKPATDFDWCGQRRVSWSAKSAWLADMEDQVRGIGQLR
ncbi:unnamed protein product [Closterium sp. NIES-53]